MIVIRGKVLRRRFMTRSEESEEVSGKNLPTDEMNDQKCRKCNEFAQKV